MGSKIWKKRKPKRSKSDSLSFPPLKKDDEFLSFKDDAKKLSRRPLKNSFSSVSG
jgi:hypothetical protein